VPTPCDLGPDAGYGAGALGTAPANEAILHHLETDPTDDASPAAGAAGRLGGVARKIPDVHVLEPLGPRQLPCPLEGRRRGGRQVGQAVGGVEAGELERDRSRSSASESLRVGITRTTISSQVPAACTCSIDRNTGPSSPRTTSR
jgi:hypothetical protein